MPQTKPELVKVEALEAFTVTREYGQFHCDPASKRNKTGVVPADAVAELKRLGKIKVLTDKPQLDHDGDGKAGGSLPKVKPASKPKAPKKGKAPTELGEARKRYYEVFGKRPGPRWSVEDIDAKIATGFVKVVDDGEADAPPV